MRSALANLPQSLLKAYQKVFDQMQAGPKGEAFEAMSWIFHAPRPLRMEELCEALAIEIGDRNINRDNVPNPNRIIHVCESLVKEVNGVVRFTHLTVFEYLQTLYKRRSPDILPASHLAKVCLTYLQHDIFAEPCHPDQELEGKVKEYKFSKYAAQYWGYHTRGDSEKNESLREMVFGTFQSRNHGIVQSVYELRNAWRFEHYDQNSTLLHLFAEEG